MSVAVTFLGSGGAFTDFRVNYHTNAVVETTAGYVLIDCGATAVQSLKELGIPVWDVAGVIITHMHGDHMGGLEQLLWERYYTGPNGPGWLSTPVHAPRDIHLSLRNSLRECVDEITTPKGTRQGGYDRLVVIEVEDVGGMGAEIGGVIFDFYRTRHVVGPSVDKPCYGVEIDVIGGGRAYYSSDTVFNRALFDRRPGDARTVFHDCAFSPKYPGTVHTHYEELLTLPEDVRSRIVLMHHTEVPDGIDPEADGFKGVATRHSTWWVG